MQHAHVHLHAWLNGSLGVSSRVSLAELAPIVPALVPGRFILLAARVRGSRLNDRS